MYHSNSNKADASSRVILSLKPVTCIFKYFFQEFGLDMFFRQHWKDQRLSHNLTSKITLTMGTKHPADYIWVPDTVFVDATKSYMHNVLTTNHKIDISADGQVDWGTRLVCEFIRPLSKVRSKQSALMTQRHFGGKT